MHPLLIILDIETVPRVPNYEDLAPSWQALWKQKVKYYLSDHSSPSDLWMQRAAIYAEFAKVVCIGLGVLDLRQPTDAQLFLKNLYKPKESTLLNLFIKEVEIIFSKYPKVIFAGHNINEFDLPFICRRMLANTIRIPNFMPKATSKPWQYNSYDTMQHWRFGDYKNFTSLNLIAHTLGIPSSKQNMDGSQVANYYYEKKDMESIINYCQQDVILTSQTILKFEGRNLLSEDQIQQLS